MSGSIDGEGGLIPSKVLRSFINGSYIYARYEMGGLDSRDNQAAYLGSYATRTSRASARNHSAMYIQR